MAYDFNLKTGFFKTEKCKLYIGHKKLKIIPKESDCPLKVIINEDELISININRENLRLIDIEINTIKGSYRGIFEESDKTKEVICVLAGKFGKKVIF